MVRGALRKVQPLVVSGLHKKVNCPQHVAAVNTLRGRIAATSNHMSVAPRRRSREAPAVAGVVACAFALTPGASVCPILDASAHTVDHLQLKVSKPSN
jgi:hypothetical protein